MSVPIITSPSRSGFSPQLSLSYDTGSGNGYFGFGWSLSTPSISRKTDKGLPQYRDSGDSDVFILSGAEDLVPAFKKDEHGNWSRDSQGNLVIDEEERDGYVIRQYRPRIEGLFARIERWTRKSDGDTYWRSITRDNITTWYGKDNSSRIFDPADPTPNHPSRIFTWLIYASYDDKGNAISYEYVHENSDGVGLGRAHERNRTNDSRATNRYLKRIKYGNRTPNRDADWNASDPVQLTEWMFEVVFDYGEGHILEDQPDQQLFITAQIDPPLGAHWPIRQDPFSTYRPGFEVRTYRLCRRVLMFHHFAQELGITECLVRSTEFVYTEGPIASFITSISQSGYLRQPTTNQPNRYLRRSLPPLEFEYSHVPDADKLTKQPIQAVDGASLENLPYGLDGADYQWIDLDGEGMSGILTEQATAWFYKRNLSPNNQVRDDKTERTLARFGPMELVAAKPHSSIAGGQAQFLDLAGDGQVDLVQMEAPVRGFYEHTDDARWASLRPFVSWPNLDMRDPNLKFIDLDGDGFVDVLVTEHETFTWYQSLAEDGFGPPQHVRKALDEEQGPRLVFADSIQSIYLADLSGDGLTDLMRIRNGEVCYWPNLGYGRFGAKITMDNAPWFDAPDQFDQRRIRLADIDGSGITDILYLRRDGVQIYFNQSGNRWDNAVPLSQLPTIDNLASVQVLDLLGNGTACLVWSSPLPSNRHTMYYIDMMNGRKPHLLTRQINNQGAETHIRYAPSTKFYLDDKQASRPWISRLPFPVHVVERVETYDHISGNRFVTRYAYHHGYFDGVEREFRGFGMVEQWDTEEIGIGDTNFADAADTNWDEASSVPTVLTRTWFHIGVYMGRDRISNFYAGLLNREDAGEYYREPGLDDAEASQLLLDDTALPASLTPDEEREAARALKGSMLRQEIYAQDHTAQAKHPYIIVEQNFTIEHLQPRNTNRHAVFFTHAREALSYHYERNPQDPRISHTLTLEVDEFGNILKSAAIGYGRRKQIRVVDGQGNVSEIPNPDLYQLDLQDQAKQTTALITFTENHFTGMIANAEKYRTPLPCETRTYELTGYTPTGAAGRFQAQDFVQADPNNPGALIPAFDREIAYIGQPAGGRERRLIERVRTLYRKDDLSGPALLGELPSLALPFESYRLAFTPGLLTLVYQRPRNGQLPENLLPNPVDVLPIDDVAGIVADRGGYVSLDDDEQWWVPSGRVFYSANSGDDAAHELAYARQHFFLPHRYRDPFTQTTTIRYDKHDLLLIETQDPLGNVVTTETQDDSGVSAIRNDYRVLQPYWVTDPNGNRVRVSFDALGLVVGTAVMGKPGALQGDLLDSAFETDLDLAVIQDFVSDPHGQTGTLLKQATTRIVYDLDRFRRCAQPAFAASLLRETHVGDLPQNTETKIQISFVYSDGFGRIVQTKIQAEAGDAPRRDADVDLDSGDTRPGELLRDANGTIVQSHAAERWVGTGRTVYNNKGNPVKQYEPFFSGTHLYEPEPDMTDTGVTPILFYDPLERVIATLHPNHTYEKVIFNPWRQASFDVNDTVTFDPQTDTNVTPFFEHLPAADYLPSWHAQRINGGQGAAEQDAARKATQHADTPTSVHFDTLGRTFLSIVDNGTDTNGNRQQYSTHVVLDIEGNQRTLIDARNRIVMRYAYDMLGNRIHQASMEAGQQWMLNDATGKPIRAWDSRGFTRRMNYDVLRRATDLVVRYRSGNEWLAVRTVYGEAQGDATNHRGRVYQVFDAAGKVTNEAYDFKGNLLRSKRKLLADYKNQPDWFGIPVYEAEEFISGTHYDALNRPIQIVAPHSDRTGATAPITINVIRPGYNEANLLERVDVWLDLAVEPVTLLDPSVSPSSGLGVANINYNAKGQRTLIEYGNGVTTQYTYDDLTFRLIQLTTTRSTGGNGLATQLFADPGTVQDLHYTYDPIGNITRIADEAILDITFNNQLVAAVSRYTYDAIYRLILADGREHIGQTTFDPNPPNDNHRDYPFFGLRAQPNNPQAVRNYSETYDYDEVGNMMRVGHQAGGAGWSRMYRYQARSLLDPGVFNNRLTSTEVGNNITETYGYLDAQGNDVDGCMTSINATQMEWDFDHRLDMVGLGGGGKTYYVYDVGGQRVRKVWEKAAGLIEERIYLSGFEIFRKRTPNDLLERETLHLMDDQQRIALIETRTVDTAGTDLAPRQLVRYQHGNHLGSAMVELDDQALLISYEEYYPYGSTSYETVRGQTETPKRFRYMGKERDAESGLYYHGARYYAPWLGRWTSCDPVISANLYQYTNSNPILLVDPDGRAGKVSLFDSFRALLRYDTSQIADPDKQSEAAEFRRQLEANYQETNEQNAADDVDVEADQRHTFSERVHAFLQMDLSFGLAGREAEYERQALNYLANIPIGRKARELMGTLAEVDPSLQETAGNVGREFLSDTFGGIAATEQRRGATTWSSAPEMGKGIGELTYKGGREIAIQVAVGVAFKFGGSLLIMAEEAGLAEYIEGRAFVAAHGTTAEFAEKIIESQGGVLAKTGGNFGGRFFVALDAQVADEFAARTVSKFGGQKGIVGVAIPEDIFNKLKKEGLVIIREIPDRAAREVVFEPGAIATLQKEGYFFSINPGQ